MPKCQYADQTVDPDSTLPQRLLAVVQFKFLEQQFEFEFELELESGIIQQ